MAASAKERAEQRAFTEEWRLVGGSLHFTPKRRALQDILVLAREAVAPFCSNSNKRLNFGKAEGTMHGERSQILVTIGFVK